MNSQMRFSPTVEERLSGAVMAVLRHIARQYGREKVMDHVDHRDFVDKFREDLGPIIDRELKTAKLAGLQVANGERERLKKALVEELSKT